MHLNFLTEYEPYIFLAIGLVVVIYSLFGKATKSNLKQTGIPVDGIIFAQGSDGNVNSSGVNNNITVRFVTLDEEWITGKINQEFQLFYTGQYKDGDTVKVYYDKNKPTDFYIDTRQSEVISRVILCFTGITVISISLYKLFM